MNGLLGIYGADSGEDADFHEAMGYEDQDKPELINNGKFGKLIYSYSFGGFVVICILLLVDVYVKI